jgi:2-oxoisovalerate dehydrogenase E1 component beta subunit
MIAFADAIKLALRNALMQDPSVVLLGQDIGRNGGVFRVTDGLWRDFPERVWDTPLAESMMVGLSIGLASQGLRPVMECQFLGFLYAGLDQLISHATRLSHRTNGRLRCPLVIRTPYGGGLRAPEHHVESTESLWASVPGLQVIVPSTPSKAYGLLLSSLQSLEPVLFLEPIRFYRLLSEQDVTYRSNMPLLGADIERTGDDVTIIAWGHAMLAARKAADRLKHQNIGVTLVDAYSLNPMDVSTLTEAARATKRCVIVQEARAHCSVGKAIAHALNHYSPILISGPDTPCVFSEVHNLYEPCVETIVKAAQ